MVSGIQEIKRRLIDKWQKAGLNKEEVDEKLRVFNSVFSDNDDIESKYLEKPPGKGYPIEAIYRPKPKKGS